MAERKSLKELESLERQLIELEKLAGGDQAVELEIEQLKQRVGDLRKEVFAHLSAWQKVQLARHPLRPYTLDYVEMLFQSFQELHGDRAFADDPAIVCGMGLFHDRPVIVVGHQKGRDTKERLRRNFGQPKPEGYRKALRMMQLAAKFQRPILCFVDTQGAYPGIDAEERGQAEAIARNLREISKIAVPIIVTVTGEGGSGGALAIAIGDKINILENAFYSVISPEGCASIMWRDAGKAEAAAEALKITAEDLLGLGLVDEIVSEPEGGAHKDPKRMGEILDEVLLRSLDSLADLRGDVLLERRYQRFRLMGQFFHEFAAD